MFQLCPQACKSEIWAERIAKHDPVVSRHQGMMILDGGGKLAGIITRGDVLRALDQNPWGDDCARSGEPESGGYTSGREPA
jgi:hypothetical protein